MVLELMDIDDFFFDGGLLIVLTVALVLFGIQCYAAFKLWRRGQGEYKLRFIVLLIATLVVLFGLFGILPLVVPGMSFLLWPAIDVLVVTIPLAAIFLIILYIRDKSNAKEDKA